MLLQWHITDRCNLRCRHCYQAAYGGDELPLAALLEVLTQFEQLVTARQASERSEGRGRVASHVTVTGGEPLLREDLFDFLTALRARPASRRFALLTNGTLIDAATAQRLAALQPTFVQVSIEGTPATHDAIRGAGAFDRAVAGLQHLVRQRVPTMLSFSAHRGNYREFAAVAWLGAALGVGRVWCDRVIPCGSGAELADQVLTPAETRELFESMGAVRSEIEGRRKHRTEIAMHRALQFLVGGGEPYRCKAGSSLLTILPNGDLLPCRRLPITVGNVLQTPLATLYRESEVLRGLRESAPPSACGDCVYRRACRGGLRCLAYAATGDLSSLDPGCWQPGRDASSPPPALANDCSTPQRPT